MILKNCTTCIIYGMEDGVKVRSRVRCVDENITLHFDDNNDLGLHTDQLRIDFFDSYVGYIKSLCELEIRKNTDPYVLEPWVADCKILEILEIMQRQKDLRVRVVKDMNFISPARGLFQGVIQNISVGGIYMTTSTKLETDEEFEFRYSFMKKEHEVKARVLRETRIKDKFYGYGCQFIELPKIAEKDIRQFVYRQQLTRVW